MITVISRSSRSTLHHSFARTEKGQTNSLKLCPIQLRAKLPGSSTRRADKHETVVTKMEIVFFQPVLGQIMGQPSEKQANCGIRRNSRACD
ncbi:hypothetical protein BofuT4_P114800.1 [Botrytis cinerea T4]|uniref:Uncharacterized protein n=1 Tax=Botryotinia fuckeliana (strain T4) TaxID=999810 RepID=G2Y284_BOTF4|nr:hypothetical protein BofuT4_P114800.1 [Botrytis cinerea T4]